MPNPGFLSGYKTYIISVTTILSAVVAFAIGEPIPGTEVVPSLEAVAQLVLTAVLAMTLRSGINDTTITVNFDDPN